MYLLYLDTRISLIFQTILKMNISRSTWKNGTRVIHGGTKKCSGIHRNFSSATMKYLSAVFPCIIVKFYTEHGMQSNVLTSQRCEISKFRLKPIKRGCN